ncbi:response regulator transcription factor [Alsobacter sp. KACC 23698]|uniref:Response regulator transcription factor n=1 Tax=Alsobacter sp. KACC 23698 TaxID=3149229 RepID=A0AAU7JKC7_9HYPH
MLLTASLGRANRVTEVSTMANMISTVVLEPNVLLREGLLKILEGRRFKIVAAGARLEQIIPTLGKLKPNLFIVCPEVVSGDVKALLTTLRQGYPDARVAILAGSPDHAQMQSAVSFGANAYLLKSMSSEIFIKALELSLLNVTVVPTEAFRNAEPTPEPIQAPAEPKGLMVEARSPSPVPRLSDREISILHSLVHGESNKHIARELEIAEATVKVHVKAILRKIRVRNRTQAAIWAMSNRLLPSATAAAQVTESPLFQASLPIHA